MARTQTLTTTWSRLGGDQISQGVSYSASGEANATFAVANSSTSVYNIGGSTLGATPLVKLIYVTSTQTVTVHFTDPTSTAVSVTVGPATPFAWTNDGSMVGMFSSLASLFSVEIDNSSGAVATVQIKVLYEAAL
jgi:hypothetical protein